MILTKTDPETRRYLTKRLQAGGNPRISRSLQMELETQKSMASTTGRDSGRRRRARRRSGGHASTSWLAGRRGGDELLAEVIDWLVGWEVIDSYQSKEACIVDVFDVFDCMKDALWFSCPSVFTTSIDRRICVWDWRTARWRGSR